MTAFLHVFSTLVFLFFLYNMADRMPHTGCTLLCMIDSSLCLFSHLFPLQKSSAFYKVRHLCVCGVGGDHSVMLELLILIMLTRF